MRHAPRSAPGERGSCHPSPVKEAALELGLRVSHSMEDVAEAGVELAVVVAYGRIIPVTLLERVPMVNLHFSLLPRWRGAAPVERAILAGDPETGVCVMKLEEGLDTGPVYARRVVPIGSDTDLIALRAELVEVGSALLAESLAGGLAGLPAPEPQEGEPTVAPKLTPEDLHLDWEDAALQLHRVRAARPGAGRHSAAGGCGSWRRRRPSRGPMETRISDRRAHWWGRRWSRDGARCSCDGYSRRAERRWPQRSGSGVCASRSVSASAATKHGFGDRDSN